MSISYTIAGITGTTGFTNQVTMRKFDTAEWRIITENVDQVRGIYTTTYHLIASGKEHPVYLIIHSALNGTQTYNKAEVQTYLVTSDSVTGLDEYEPQTFTLSWKHSGLEQKAVLHAAQWICALGGLVWQDAASNAQTGNLLRKCNVGDTDTLSSVYTDLAIN